MIKEQIPSAEYMDIQNGVDATIVLKAGRNRFEWRPTRAGTFHLSSAKHCATYSITVWKDRGHLSVADGTGRIIHKFPSLFTGSFNISGYAEGGLFARCGGVGNVMTPFLVTWTELNDSSV